MIVNIKGRDVHIDDDMMHVYRSRVWHISDSGYVVWRGIIDGKKQTVRMHRVIAGAKDGEIVDHINRNKLDNRRENLRITTQSVNIRNTDRYDNARHYYFDNTKQRWAIDSRKYGVRGMYFDTEQGCVDYLDALDSGQTPVRTFTRRPSLGGRKITDAEIDYIFKEYNMGNRTKRSIAIELGYSESAIGRLLNGRTTMGGKISKRGKAKKIQVI